MFSSFRFLKALGLSLAISAVGAPLYSAPATAQSSLGIAAVVNDDVISMLDLNARVWLTMASAQMENTPETRKRLASTILRKLIDEKLKLQEAKRVNVTVTDADLDNSMATLERRNNLKPGGLDAYLKQNGIDQTSLADQMEAEIAWLKVIRRVLGPRITVTKEEVDERLAQMKANQGRPERNLWEIFLPIDSPELANEVLSLAQRLRQELQQRRPFQDIARNFSRSPSAALGGDMGWVPIGGMPTEVETILASMEPGQLSPPIQAAGGYYLIVFVNQRTAPTVDAEEKAVLDLHQLFLSVPEQADDAAVTTQLTRARDMASSAKSCADMDRIGKESASSLSGSLGKIGEDKLPETLQAAVRNLAVATPSEPVRTRDGVVVLMVCSREAPKSGKSTRQEIQDRLFNQRLLAAAEEHLRDLRRQAFVDVRL